MDHSGDFYRQIVEWSRDGYWVIDPHGGTLFATERAARLLGRTRAEMMDTNVLDVLDDPGRGQFRTHLEELREVGENPHEVECRYLRKDGSPVHLLVSESTVYDAGRPVAYVHRMTADADREMLLGELSRSRDLLDEAQAIAKLGSWDFDMVTGSLIWSRELYTIFSVDPSSFVPTQEGFLGLVLEDDRPLVVEAIQRGEKEGAFEFKARMARRDGTVGWFHGLGRVTYDTDSGAPVRMQGTAQDITELKQAQLELEDQVTINTLMQFIATASNKAATLKEALELIQQLLLAHPDWQRAVAFGVASDEHGRRLVAQPVLDHGHEPHPRELRTAERVLESLQTVFEEDAEPQTPQIGFPVIFDGSPVASIVITAATPFERHVMLRSLVEQVAEQLARVVERETAALEIAVARDSALEASRLKSAFLAAMSHEIRTPMNGVIGLNELLLRTGLDDRQRQLAEGVKSAGRTLMSVINNVLDFSKIEAGELEIESTVFGPRASVEQVLALIEGAAVDREVTLHLDVADAVPELVVGDPTRFGQILTNLVGNAVKFTRRGQVFVRLDATDATDSQDGDVEIAVEVEDTGIGIEPEHLATLFEPFRQADASTTRAFGGTGLGLAISRQLAEALGGRITVTSRPGDGSVFRFSAVFRTAAAIAGPASATDGPRRRPRPTGRVLVAEDNEINQLVAVGLLEAIGYTADVVTNGQEAVEHASGESYAAILMDLQMPTMDGYAATRAIRSAEAPGIRVPIIALTASATESERESCIAAGMDDFLTKPVQVDRLAAVLQSLGRPEETPEATATPEPARHEASAQVLDPSRLDELVEMGGGAAALVDRAIDNFMTRSPTTLADLRAAIAADHHQQLRAGAHHLKGSALNLGATLVADLAAELEAAAADLDQSLADVDRSLVDRLASALDDTVTALGHWRQPPER